MMPTKFNLKSFLNDLFKIYDDISIRYCILRNYESLPDQLTSSDIDILISCRDKARNREILFSLIKKYYLTVYGYYVDERFDQYYLCRKISMDDIFILRIDFFFNSELYGVKLIDGEAIIDEREEYNNFYVADDAYKLLDKWLYLYLLNAQLPNRYYAEFAQIVSRRAAKIKQVLIDVMGKKRGEFLFERLATKGFNKLPQVSKIERFFILFRCLVKDPIYHFIHLPQFFYYRIKYFFFHQGEFISFSGPDGCGKTTIMELAYTYLGKAFPVSKNGIFHFRPSLFPRIADVGHKMKVISMVDEDYHIPYRAKPSKFPGSIARTVYYLLDFIIGYFIKVRPLLVRRQLVMFDRYYYDMIADPERSNISLPFPLLNLFLYFVPKPNSSFFIFVNSKTVMKRKKELIEERIETLNEQYAKLAERHKNFIQIPNKHNPNITAAAVVDSIIQRRARRLALSFMGADSIKYKGS